LANSYDAILSAVQVAPGVTFTIQLGVDFNRLGYTGEGHFQIWGNLNAIGTEASKIMFNELTIASYDDNSTFTVRHCQFNGHSTQWN
jgi:hypothetical protein